MAACLKACLDTSFLRGDTVRVLRTSAKLKKHGLGARASLPSLPETKRLTSSAHGSVPISLFVRQQSFAALPSTVHASRGDALRVYHSLTMRGPLPIGRVGLVPCAGGLRLRRLVPTAKKCELCASRFRYRDLRAQKLPTLVSLTAVARGPAHREAALIHDQDLP